MRKHYLDNIRWATVALVVIYHVIYMFNGVVTDGVIGSAAPHWIDGALYLMYPWFMVLLFIVAGMCARYSLNSHTGKEFLKSRTRKLLVPSTIGLFVLGWVQGYVNMAISDAFVNIPDVAPAPVLYLIMVLSGTGVLWFAQMLWLFSVLLLLVRKLEKGKLYSLAGKANVPLLLVLGLLFYGSSQVLNTPIIAVYRFGVYGFSFFAGYFLFANEKVTDRLAGAAVPMGIVALALGITYAVIHFGHNYAVSPCVNSPLACAFGWVACLAILGGMKRWGNQRSGFTDFMAKRSFGLYVLHYLPLSAAAFWIPVDGWLRYGVAAIAAFGGGWLLYEIIVRIPVIRWCVLGVRKETYVQR